MSDNIFTRPGFSEFDPDKLEPSGPLHESFDAMARANGVHKKVTRG